MLGLVFEMLFTGVTPIVGGISFEGIEPVRDLAIIDLKQASDVSRGQVELTVKSECLLPEFVEWSVSHSSPLVAHRDDRDSGTPLGVVSRPVPLRRRFGWRDS